MDFVSDARQSIVRYFKANSISYDKSWNTSRMAVAYFDTLNKIIWPVKYKIYYSKEFKSTYKYLSSEEQTSLNEITQLLNQGKSVFKYQNARSTIRKSEKPDLLLANWGIYHLHLNRGSDNLLFVYIKKTNVYFIDVTKHPHKTWSLKYFLETLDDNWPYLIDEKVVTGITALTEFPSDEQIYDSMKGGALILLDVHGKIIMPPAFGTASDRSSIMAVKAADILMESVENLQKTINVDSELYYQELQIKHPLSSYKLKKDMQFHIEISGNKILLYEDSTNTLCHRFIIK